MKAVASLNEGHNSLDMLSSRWYSALRRSSSAPAPLFAGSFRQGILRCNSWNRRWTQSRSAHVFKNSCLTSPVSLIVFRPSSILRSRSEIVPTRSKASPSIAYSLIPEGHSVVTM